MSEVIDEVMRLYNKKPETVKPGDIVQLSPDTTNNKMFGAALMIVTEVKSWGVQGYVQALGENGEMGGQAYYRASFGTFEMTGGKAVWDLQREERDDV